jgi:ABC-type branched-subunit amino acid transport system ATPase component
MLGYKQGNVTFDSFDVLVGIGVFATAYLAGITSVSGGILAGLLVANGIVFYASSQWLNLGDWYGTITGVGLVLTVVLNPEGIVGPAHVALEKMRTRRAVGREPAPAGVRPVAVAPVAPPDPELLSLHDVRVAYGGVIAVENVSMDVAEGTIVGLIGPNGAGKTTLLDAISGFARASGSVKLGGRELGRLPPHRRIRAGLGRTFQQIELYDDLTVRENVVAGLAARERRRASEDDLQRTLELLELTDLAELPAGELSQGRRQLVSIARALIGDPRVVLLDEPASGLDTAESEWLGERLRTIRDSGVTILLVDHDMHLVLNLCEQIHVLDFGRLIASGPPAAIKADRRVTEAYLGSTHAEQTTAAT